MDVAHRNVQLYSVTAVVAEDPGGGPEHGHYLANFHRVAFSRVRVTSRNGTVGHLHSNKLWGAYKITMTYKGIVMAAASGRLSRDTAFAVAFHSRG
jgi:hypothetical protein